MTYLIFVPLNLHASIVHRFHWQASSPSFWLMVMVSIQVPLSWIRDIRRLTPTNLAANGCILYGLTVCLYYAVVSILSGPPDDSLWNNLCHHASSIRPFGPDWVLFIGTSVCITRERFWMGLCLVLTVSPRLFGKLNPFSGFAL